MNPPRRSIINREIHHDPMVIRLRSPGAMLPPEEPQPPRPRTLLPKEKKLQLMNMRVYAGILAALCVFSAIYGFSHHSSAHGITPNMTQVQIIAHIGTLILLPDETPTVAAVADLKPLSNQVFFKNARVGDIVLMYKKAARAYLYDPKLDKIIEVGPITTTNK